MSTIEKKIRPEFFEMVLAGSNHFEVRVANFEVSTGDTILLREWDPKSASYTGRSVEKTVSFVNKVDLDKIGDVDEIVKKGLYIMEIE
jgi:hypothetical protein